MAGREQIETFLAAYPPPIQQLAHAARRLLESALPGIEETLDSSASLIGYSYGPGYKGVVSTLIMSQDGVKIGILRGSELPDPRQLMKGSGKLHRYVEIRNLVDLEQPGITPLLEQALAAWRDRNQNASSQPASDR